VLKGYAAVFNSLSEEIRGGGRGFREVIMPGAFDRALKEGHDVRALLNHNPDIVLGRTKAKTLRLEVDDTGLLATITPPDTRTGQDVVASVERGDLSQMSFGFRVLADEWRRQDGEPVREVRDLELLDVSIVAYPAYTETSVSTRALAMAKEMREAVPGLKPVWTAYARVKLAESETE
jgi:HK97 family phage prohead protease